MSTASPFSMLPQVLMARRFILKGLNEIWNNSSPNYTAGLVSEDIFHWKASLKGPTNTPYEGGVFILSIHFSPDYPLKPPKVGFKTKVYHPNITPIGAIQLDILQNKWSPLFTISKLLMRLYHLLEKPVIEEGARFDELVATFYVLERDTFDETARSWTKTHAMGV